MADTQTAEATQVVARGAVPVRISPSGRHRSNPFEGRAGLILRLLTPFRWFFNLPGQLNVRQAKKIVEIGEGTIYGYDTIVLAYPLVPIGILFSLIQWIFPGPEVQMSLGLIYALLIWLVIVTIGTDVGHKTVGLWGGILVSLAVTWSVLQLTGTLDVNNWLYQFVKAFSPQFHIGTALFISVFLAISMGVTFVKSRAHQLIKLRGNLFIPARLHSESTYPVEDYRVISSTKDWLEVFLLRARAVYLLQTVQFASIKEKDDVDDLAVVALRVVPCAPVILHAVQYATSRTEVE